MNKIHKLLSLLLSTGIVISAFPSSGTGAISESIAFYNSKKSILEMKEYDEAYDTNHDGIVNVFDVIRENKEVFQEESYTDLKSKIYSLETQIEILTQKLAEKEDKTQAESDLSEINSALSGKVDLQDGKQLSSNDYTNEEKLKLHSLNNYDDTSVKSDISDISSALSGKVDIQEGKQLSSNDYTDSDKKKLESFENYDDTKLIKKIDLLVEIAYEEKSQVEASINSKVDKEEGKQLSSNDYTNEDKEKLETLKNYDDTEIKSKLNFTNYLGMFEKIICCGDSLTYSQVYISDTETRQAYQTYPTVLGKLSGTSTELYATPGITTKGWYETYNEILNVKNACYIIYLGTNGGLTNTVDLDCSGNDVSIFADNNTGNYGKILQKITDNGGKIILIKPYICGGDGSNIDDTISAIDNFAIKYNCVVLENERLDSSYYSKYPDGSGQNYVHYNDMGYTKFAQMIYNQVGLLSEKEVYKIMPN